MPRPCDSVRKILQRKCDEWDDGAMHADLKRGLTNARTLIEPQRVAFSTSPPFRVRISRCVLLAKDANAAFVLD